MMLGRSLRLRLAVTSILWIAATLIVLWLFIMMIFRDHEERHFLATLSDLMDEFVATGELMEDVGSLLTWFPREQRFDTPDSGWYWQTSWSGVVVTQSDSLGERRLDQPSPGTSGEPWFGEMKGPSGDRVYGVSRTFLLERAKEPFTILITGPASLVDADLDRFSKSLLLALTVFGIALSCVVIVQVIYGLRPLAVLQKSLGEVRSGAAKRLPESFPDEIKPIVVELNALLDVNANLLKRARTRLGDLAHALKNPLMVLKNEAHNVDSRIGEQMMNHLTVVTDNIDRHLARARAAGASGLGQRTDVSVVADDILFSVSLLNRDQQIVAEAGGLEDMIFLGDTQDLEEMLGNLVDNAFKWAKYRVLVNGSLVDGRIEIAVEDDGPGIPEDQMDKVLQRGRRLDEKRPGSGLGLGIVNDLVELYYRGRLELGRSSLGGLSATLRLPGERGRAS